MPRTFLATYLADIYGGKTFLLFLAIVLPLEFLWPVQKLRLRDRLPQLLFTLLTGPAILFLMRLALAGVTGTGIRDGAWLGLGQLPRPSWKFLAPLNLAPILQSIPLHALAFAVAGLFIGDFFHYWWHRARHTMPILWPIHKLHHVDKNMNAITTIVNHPLGYPFAGFFSFALIRSYALRSMGGEPQAFSLAEAGLVYLVVHQFHGWVIHANLKWSFGPLTRILASPQSHRIHHSIEKHHQNKNFATYFPIWDILFGTYYHPAPNEWPETGVVGETLSSNPWDLFIDPFRDWAKLASAGRRNAHPETEKAPPGLSQEGPFNLNGGIELS